MCITRSNLVSLQFLNRLFCSSFLLGKVSLSGINKLFSKQRRVYIYFVDIPQIDQMNQILLNHYKMKRQNISSGAKWEDIVGYSRAVRVGNIIEVAGTTAVDENGEVVGKGDMYAQTKYIFEKMEKALQEAGASMADVVRTRMLVTDISKWEEVGRAHGEFFRTIKPASTMVEISGLINPEMLIEIEISAVLS